MKLSELQQLESGGILNHTRYGECELIRVEYVRGDFFGAVIRPNSGEGEALLALDTQTAVTDFMEDSLRRLKVSKNAIRHIC